MGSLAPDLGLITWCPWGTIGSKPAGPLDAPRKPSRPQARPRLRRQMSLSELSLHPPVTSVPTTSWLCASRRIENLSVTLKGVLLWVLPWGGGLAGRDSRPDPLALRSAGLAGEWLLSEGSWSCPRKVASLSLPPHGPLGEPPRAKSALNPLGRGPHSATAPCNLWLLSPPWGTLLVHTSQALTPQDLI